MSKKLQVLNSYATFDYTPDMINESREENDGKIVLKGILQKSETVNQNGRIYPRAILEREIRNYQKFIEESRALGECDHPDSSVVELKNVSHIIREAHLDGDVVYGTVELLDTPCGKILQSLVESGVKLGISSRGVGSTKRQGEYQVVQDDFQLICWDFVSEPSTPGAFVMREGKELIAEEDLNAFFNNSDKVDRIFNEILEWE
jgi:hypothetical protein